MGALLRHTTNQAVGLVPRPESGESSALCGVDSEGGGWSEECRELSQFLAPANLSSALILVLVLLILIVLTAGCTLVSHTSNVAV